MPRHDRPLMEQAYETLKRRIITLDLLPGQRLDDYSLSIELKLSRTPVREALYRLSAEGLVTVRGKSGFVVQTLDIVAIADLFEAHIVLAKAIAHLAAQRATPTDVQAMEKAAGSVVVAIDRRDYLRVTADNADLHRIEAAAAHSRTLHEMSVGIADQEQRLAYLCFGGGRDITGLDAHFAQVKQHHAALIDAYRTHDPAGAQQIAIEHVRLFRRRVQAYLETESVEAIAFTEAELPAVSRMD